VQTDTEALSAAADDFSDQAEKLQPFLVKANGMQPAARNKAEQLKELNHCWN